MSIDTQTTNVTSATGNVFADLGFEPQLAAELKSQSERIIADKLAIKEHLLTELAAWIQAKELTRSDAAALLGVTGQRMSDILSKQATLFTLDALVDMALRSGKTVQLSIQYCRALTETARACVHKIAARKNRSYPDGPVLLGAASSASA